MFVSTVAGSIVIPVDGSQPLRQPPRVDVVVGEAIDVVLEGVQPRRGDHTRLPHRAAPHLLVAPGLGDQLPRAREARGPARRALS